MTGNLFLYNGSPISWRSERQKKFALSTADAEYYSASRAADEVIYIRYFLWSRSGWSLEAKVIFISAEPLEHWVNPCLRRGQQCWPLLGLVMGRVPG
jgi:hypothetical protein